MGACNQPQRGIPGLMVFTLLWGLGRGLSCALAAAGASKLSSCM